MWMPQWCMDTVVYLLCTQWFFFTTHSGFSSPESQSQVEWQESSAASVHFWILANRLLWWLERRVWQYYLQTLGFLKVWTQNGRNFIWYFEQNLSDETLYSPGLCKKKGLNNPPLWMIQLRRFGMMWEIILNTCALQIPFITAINPAWWLNTMV